MSRRRESRVQRELASYVGKACKEYDLIADGDRVMVCMSGGKDSYAMARLLRRQQVVSPVRFELIAVHLDQGQPGYDGAPLERWLQENDFDYRIIRRDTYSVVLDKIPEGKTYCSLCSRLRRGILYTAARDLGCTRIALGHHREDALETVLLNLFFSGQLKSMPPKLVSDDGANVVIRPLIYCSEENLRRYAEEQQFPILPCNLCGSQDNLMRQEMKGLLTSMARRFPDAPNVALNALRNVRPSHLLDRGLWAKLGLSVADPATTGEAGA